MRLLFIVTLYNILSEILALKIINEDIGQFNLKLKVGDLPLRYMPLSEQDQRASDKAADVVDFLPLAPHIDPLYIPEAPPINIDFPFLWRPKGKISVQNFVLAGVKQLQLHGLELRLTNLRSDVNITIPQLYFEGDFGLRTAITFVPIRFQWHISANLYEVDVTVSSGGFKTMAPTIGEVLQINSADVKVHIKDVVFNLTNVGEELGEKAFRDNPVVQYLASLGSRRKKDKPNMLNVILQTALDIVNKELFKIPMSMFTDSLLSDSY